MSQASNTPSDAQKAGSGSNGGRVQGLLVVTGADHPGILDDISHYVAERRAAIEAVRVVNLSGRFALLMLVSSEEPGLGAIGQDLGLLMERTGIRASLEAAHDTNGGEGAATSFSLSAVGGGDADESMTLRQTSNLLRVLNINIRDVETRRTTGGGFDMSMKVDVPRDVPVGKLRELLGQLLGQQPVQWELAAEPVESR